jgi:hypothetical protein
MSLAIVLALLVTFVVPVVVAADDGCCTYTPPECGPLPDKTTKTLAGAAVWTMLGVADIMGKAVCATTGQMACTLGGWSDELGKVGTDVTGAALGGLGDLIKAVIDQFVPSMSTLGASLDDLLHSISDAITGAGTAT